MASCIDANKLLNEKQSGFHRYHSCVSALLDVAENIRDMNWMKELGPP